MQLSQHKTITAAQAIGAGFLLGPFIADSVLGERWPLLALSLMSVALISCYTPPESGQNRDENWLPLLALFFILLGLTFSIDKFLLLAGALLLTSVLLSVVPLSRSHTVAVTTCVCLMVPLPAGMETEIATSLASLEASLFVAIGQALDLPVRLSGTQIFYGQSVITINQDCSGTLLLIPTLLGSIAAAALSKTRGTALLALAIALPSALLTNLLRLGTVLGLIVLGDHQLADEWHDILGYTALAISWVLPLWLFANLENAHMRPESPANLSQVAPLLIAAGLVAAVTPKYEQDTPPPALQLPAYLSGWIAQTIDIPPEETRILNADSAERRLYTSANGEFLITAIYHNDPQKGREHSSERCFQAMGWRVQKRGRKLLNSADVMTFLSVSSGGYSQDVIEFVTEDTKARGGLIRLQLVIKPQFTQNQQQELMSLFADNILGDST